MEITDDKLKQFFGDNKKEIDDFGFSRRVQHKLPDLADRSWIVWLFAAAGVVVTTIVGYYSGFFASFFAMLSAVSPYLIPGIIFWVTLLAGIIMLRKQPGHLLR